jgi:phenylalanyl-tRNA synthetase beta chain
LYGRFEQEILEAYGAAHPDVWAAELEIEPFFKALEPLYQNLPKFPSLKEDISFYLDPEFLAGEVISELRKSDKLISKIDLLDVFEGAKGHSLTLGFEFLHPERTLTKEEASRVRSKLIKLLESKFRARVRKE